MGGFTYHQPKQSKSPTKRRRPRKEQNPAPPLPVLLLDPIPENTTPLPLDILSEIYHWLEPASKTKFSLTSRVFLYVSRLRVQKISVDAKPELRASHFHTHLKNFKNLLALKIPHNLSPFSHPLSDLAISQPNLVHLNLNYNVNFTSSVLENLRQITPHLKSLFGVYHTKNFPYFPQLENLYCRILDIPSFHRLIKTVGPSLQRLHCFRVDVGSNSHSIILSLLKEFPKLKQFSYFKITAGPYSVSNPQDLAERSVPKNEEKLVWDKLLH